MLFRSLICLLASDPGIKKVQDNFPDVEIICAQKDNKLNGRGKINFWVDSLNYNHIENIHQIILLTICDYISKKKF